MNFLMLKYFRTVATELNISHAANKLYISQQALSAHMRNLENELGVKLFNRMPHLSLTDAGQCLYEAARSYDEVSFSLNEKLNAIRKEERGELRIGISFTRGQFILPSVLPQYTELHPQIHINVYEERSDALFNRLLRNEIDFWITAENPSNDALKKNVLFRESFFLVVPLRLVDRVSGQAAAQAVRRKTDADFEIEDVIKCPFVLLNPGNRSRDLFDNVMRTRRLVPNIILETDNSQTAFALAQKEMAVTVYSDMFLRNYSGTLNPEVRLIPLEKYIRSDLLHVFYNREKTMSKYRQAFLDCLHSAFEKG